MLKRLFLNQKGNVVLLVALSALFLMGVIALVIDVGLMYSERAKLVSAVDAAALSGAWKLPDEVMTKTTGSNYLDKNVDKPTKIIERDIRIIEDPKDGKVICISAVKDVDLFFARIIGYTNTHIKASAKATKIYGKNRLVPLGITSTNWTNLVEDYDTYKNEDGTITLKVISSVKDEGFDSQKGNFFALALGKPGGNPYRDNLGYGYSGQLKIGDKVDTETGNMVGPTDQGLLIRLEGNLGGDACKIDPESKIITHKCGGDGEYCPRMAYVPIFQPPAGELKGNTEVVIQSFAQFFITDGNASGEIRGIFLSWTPVDQATSSSNPNHVRLIE